MSLAESITSLFDGPRSGKKKWTFTLEPGRGETYASNKPTLYAHSTYERGSVLAGRPQRTYIAQWNDWETAVRECEEVRKTVKKFRYEKIEGSTHIPVSQIVSHLPDDTDY